MNSDLRSYETFYWVARLGSFSRAAERLHTTQSAVSQRVSGLEQQLGIVLLERSGRKMAMTAKGREVCDHMERLLPLVDELRRTTRSASQPPAGARLGVDETLVHTWLANFTRRLRAVYPDISLDIMVDTSPALGTALAQGRIDLAFMMGAVSAPIAASCSLCRYPLAFVKSPSLDVEATIEAISRQPLITYPRGTFPYTALGGLLATASRSRPLIHCVSSIALMVEMIRDGAGVGFLPPAVIASELDEGDLSVLETGASLPELDFAAAIQPQSDRRFLEPIIHLAQVAERRRLRPSTDNLPLYRRITINNFLN